MIATALLLAFLIVMGLAIWDERRGARRGRGGE